MTVGDSPAPPVRLADRDWWRPIAWRVLTRTSRILALPTAPLRALPDFLIVGAQRAGTTSLHRYLLDSPAVLPARLTKGVHYFDANHERGDNWYRVHFPLRVHLETTSRGVGGHAVTGEGSPYYMFHPAVPARIAELLPDVRLLVVLRDPVQRAVSQYHHERARGFEHLPLQEALEAEERRLAGEEERLATDPSYRSHAHQHHSYVARGRYLPQLERLWAQVGEERVLVLESGELKRAPQAAVDRVAAFLGIPSWPLRDMTTHNARVYDAVDPSVQRWLADRFVDDNARLFDRLGTRWAWTS